ncbi:MAG: DUF1849 family protein [Rhodospirillaceae bacterium]|nr:DUF1849 family protein [Rhodospirillaceae bacterium]
MQQFSSIRAVAACLAALWSLPLASGAVAEGLEELAGRQSPHKAIYALAVDRVRSAANLAHAEGAIFYEFHETCTAWRIRQRFKLRITRNDREAEETETNSILVEARNGRRLSFSVVTSSDGTVTERLSGVATLGRAGAPGVVEIREPEPARIALPAGTVFPTRHFLEIVRAAERGRRSIWSTVFDGSEEGGRHSGINVVILGSRPSPGVAEPRPILRRPGWLMRVSYFAPEAADRRPTYTFRAHFTDSGVARDMVLDYGAFSLTGTLKAIEPLARPEC